MNLDDLTTVIGAAVPPDATVHEPVAEALLEGAKYDAETEDAAEAAGGGGTSAAAKTSGLGRYDNKARGSTTGNGKEEGGT